MKLIFALAVMLLGCTNMTAKTQIEPPKADKVPHIMELHGETRVDDYYWMRDDERKDPKIIAHLNAEKDYTKAQFKPYEALKKQLFEELIGRLDKDESSVPYFWHNHWYYRYYKAGFEYPLIARKVELENREELVLLDVNERAKGHDFYGLGGVSVSPDETKLVFGEDLLSRRMYTLYFKDLNSGELIKDQLEGTDGHVVWANDNQHLFYIAKDPQTLLGYQVFRHKLGTAQTEDVLVYEEKDDTFYIGLGKSLDETSIALYAESTITSEVLMLDA
ncbi:MAG: oligopeptidase B, partial [Shewanella sp.]